MKRILFLLFAVGLTANMTVMAGMSTSKVRKETRFLTDKMAYELSLSTQQYNDAYEINYDFIYSVRNIMDYVAPRNRRYCASLNIQRRSSLRISNAS